MPTTRSKKLSGTKQSREIVDDDVEANLSDSGSNYSDNGSESDEEIELEEIVDPEEAFEKGLELPVNSESKEDPDLFESSDNHSKFKKEKKQIDPATKIKAEKLYEEIIQLPSLDIEAISEGLEGLSVSLAEQGIVTINELKDPTGYRCAEVLKECTENSTDTSVKKALFKISRVLYPHPWYEVIDYVGGTRTSNHNVAQWILWELILTGKDASEFPAYLKENKKDIENKLDKNAVDSEARKRMLRALGELDDEACRLIKLMRDENKDKDINPLSLVLFCKALPKNQLYKIDDLKEPAIKGSCAQALLNVKNDPNLNIGSHSLNDLTKIWLNLYSPHTVLDEYINTVTGGEEKSTKISTAIWMFIFLATLKDKDGLLISENYFPKLLTGNRSLFIKGVAIEKVLTQVENFVLKELSAKGTEYLKSNPQDDVEIELASEILTFRETLFAQIKQRLPKEEPFSVGGFETFCRYLETQEISIDELLDDGNDYRRARLVKDCVTANPKDTHLKGAAFAFFRTFYPHPWYEVIDYVGSSSSIATVRSIGQWTLLELVLAGKNKSEFPDYVKTNRKDIESLIDANAQKGDGFRNRIFRALESLDDEACQLIKLMRSKIKGQEIDALAVVLFCKALPKNKIHKLEDLDNTEIKITCAETLLALMKDDEFKAVTQIINSLSKIWLNLYTPHPILNTYIESFQEGKEKTRKVSKAVWFFVFMTTYKDSKGQTVAEDEFAKVLIENQSGIIEGVWKGKESLSGEKAIAGKLAEVAVAHLQTHPRDNEQSEEYSNLSPEESLFRKLTSLLKTKNIKFSENTIRNVFKFLMEKQKEEKFKFSENLIITGDDNRAAFTKVIDEFRSGDKVTKHDRECAMGVWMALNPEEWSKWISRFEGPDSKVNVTMVLANLLFYLSNQKKGDGPLPEKDFQNYLHDHAKELQEKKILTGTRATLIGVFKDSSFVPPFPVFSDTAIRLGIESTSTLEMKLRAELVTRCFGGIDLASSAHFNTLTHICKLFRQNEFEDPTSLTDHGNRFELAHLIQDFKTTDTFKNLMFGFANSTLTRIWLGLYPHAGTEMYVKAFEKYPSKLNSYRMELSARVLLVLHSLKDKDGHYLELTQVAGLKYLSEHRDEIASLVMGKDKKTDYHIMKDVIDRLIKLGPKFRFIKSSFFSGDEVQQLLASTKVRDSKLAKLKASDFEVVVEEDEIDEIDIDESESLPRRSRLKKAKNNNAQFKTVDNSTSSKNRETSGETSNAIKTQMLQRSTGTSMNPDVQSLLMQLKEATLKACTPQSSFEETTTSLETFTNDMYAVVNTFGNSIQGAVNVLDEKDTNALINGIKTEFENLGRSDAIEDADIQSTAEDIVERISKMLRENHMRASRGRTNRISEEEFKAHFDRLCQGMHSAMENYFPLQIRQDNEGDIAMLNVEESSADQSRKKGKKVANKDEVESHALPYRTIGKRSHATFSSTALGLKKKRQKDNKGNPIAKTTNASVQIDISGSYQEKNDRQLQFASLKRGEKVESIEVIFTDEDKALLREDIAGRFGKDYRRLSGNQKSAVEARIEILRKKLEDQYQLILAGKSPFEGIIQEDDVQLKDVQHNEIGALVLNPNKGIRKIAISAHQQGVDEVDSLGPVVGEEITKEEYDRRVKVDPDLLNSPFVIEVTPTKYVIMENLLRLGNAPAHFDPAVGSHIYHDGANAVFRDATVRLKIEGEKEPIDERSAWLPGFDINQNASILIDYGPHYLELLNRSFLKQIIEQYGEDNMGEWLEAYETRSEKLIQDLKKRREPRLQNDDAYLPWMMAGLNAEHEELRGEVFDSVKALEAKLQNTENGSKVRGIVRLSHTHYVTVNILKDKEGHLTSQIFEPANREEYLSKEGEEATDLEKVLCHGEKDLLTQFKVRSQKTLQECGIHATDYLPFIKAYEPYFDQLMKLQIEGKAIPTDASEISADESIPLEDQEMERPINTIREKVQQIEDCRRLLPPDFYKNMTDIVQIRRAIDKNENNQRWNWQATMKDGRTIKDYIKGPQVVKNLKYYEQGCKGKWPEIKEANLAIFQRRLELIQGARRQYELSREFRPHRLRKDAALVSLALEIEAEARDKKQTFAATVQAYQYRYKASVLRRLGEEFDNPTRAPLLAKKQLVDKAMAEVGLAVAIPLPSLNKQEASLPLPMEDTPMPDVSRPGPSTPQKTWEQVRQAYDRHIQPTGKFAGDAKYGKFAECIDDFIRYAKNSCPMTMGVHELVGKMNEWFFSKATQRSYKNLRPTPIIGVQHLVQTLHSQYRFDVYRGFAELIIPEEKRNDLHKLEGYYQQVAKGTASEKVGYREHIKMIYCAMMEAWETQDVLQTLKEFQKDRKVLSEKIAVVEACMEAGSRYRHQDRETQDQIKLIAKQLMNGYEEPDHIRRQVATGASTSDYQKEIANTPRRSTRTVRGRP